jgi:hypothetical protein
MEAVPRRSHQPGGPGNSDRPGCPIDLVAVVIPKQIQPCARAGLEDPQGQPCLRRHEKEPPKKSTTPIDVIRLDRTLQELTDPLLMPGDDLEEGRAHASSRPRLRRTGKRLQCRAWGLEDDMVYGGHGTERRGRGRHTPVGPISAICRDLCAGGILDVGRWSHRIQASLTHRLGGRSHARLSPEPREVPRWLNFTLPPA